jgi:hypothetical protein
MHVLNPYTKLCMLTVAGIKRIEKNFSSTQTLTSIREISVELFQRAYMPDVSFYFSENCGEPNTPHVHVIL